MSYKSNLSKLVSGEPVRCITRIRPDPSNRKEDIKVLNQNISLVDANNRLVEEFECEEVYMPETPIQQLYDRSLSQYLFAFTQGFSVSVFGFGASGAGKTQTIEGNKKEPGVILMFADALFNSMENKKYHTNNAQNQISNFSYVVRIRYIEIVDEEIKDLLSTTREELYVVNNEWEGPVVQGAKWLTVSNAAELNEHLVRGQKNRVTGANEFGKLSDKATSMFTIELLQNTELQDSKESLFLVSRATFIDLPGAEVLLEDPEALRIREGSTMNKSMICFGNLIKDLSMSKGEFVYYEGSILTQLCRDVLGGNSLTIGIFNIAYGDIKKTANTLNYMKYAKRIINFPVVTDGKIIGLLKKYRSEIIQLLGSRAAGGEGGGEHYLKMAELEKRLIDDNMDKLKMIDEKQKLAAKLSELREKYNQLVKSKADLQNELIQCEEEKLEISKALVELQIENTRLLEVLQNEKYDANNRLLNAENDLIGASMKEEQAMKVIRELQDRIKELSDEKRDLEIEFVALKKNFINIRHDYENEKLKNENMSLEIINLNNENKALQAELNDTFKRANLGGEENERYLNRLSKLERENNEKAQALIEAKAEIERLKTELVKYDVLAEKHRLELDTRKLEVERGFMEMSKDTFSEKERIKSEIESQARRTKEDKMLWESEKIELTHKNKLQARQIGELEDRIKELQRSNEELSNENNKMLIQIDEMRSVYRQKLLQFMSDQSKGNTGGRIGYDLNAREELIRTYTEKEIEMREQLDSAKHQIKQLKMELRALKSYARSLKHLAEDWAPVGVPLPEILNRPPPVKIDDDYGGGLKGAQEEELERLRARNRRLEEDLKMAQNQLAATEDLMRLKSGDEKDFNAKIYTEISRLKTQQAGNSRMQSRGGDIEQLRKERNDLQEENRRLINLLKDNKKWDIYLLQKENEKLARALKEYEANDSVAPISGDALGLKQKVLFYEKNMKQLEKERSELIVRATMAEEQLKQLQEHLNKTTQEYSKKIHELKKQLQQR